MKDNGNLRLQCLERPYEKKSKEKYIKILFDYYILLNHNITLYDLFHIEKTCDYQQKIGKNETNSDSFFYNNDVHSWWCYIFLSYFQLLVLSQRQKNSKEILLFNLSNKYERIFYSFIHYFRRGSFLPIRYF